MCETLRAELNLSFKFSTLDLTVVGAHYDVPNDSQQLIGACHLLSAKITVPLISTVKKYTDVDITIIQFSGLCQNKDAASRHECVKR